ncbi:unnamed protein product, partial [Sphacelaria rigidula]
ARITEARQFLESCADDDGVRPATLVKNYQPSSDFLCTRHDCLCRSIDRHRITSTRRKANSLPPVSCTPVTVGLTPPPTPAEPGFVAEVRQKVIATVEEGRLVGVEDVQSWLIEARTA